jgi:hypothetical protein
LWKLIDSGEVPKLVVYHIVGLDGYLHNSEFPDHEYIRLGVKHYDRLMRVLTQKIDEKTTILAFGDHGFDSSNDHGLDTLDIMSTVMFAYQKGGFPLKNWYLEHQNEFKNAD